MERADLTQLHYICHIDNLPSILANGILSHRRAQRHRPTRIANEDVQALRAKKTVPRGQPLHDYANLYLNARNPMLYQVTRAGEHVDRLCVLSVSPAVLDQEDVVLADGNAAAGATAFRPVREGLAKMSRTRVFAQYWTHPGDPVAEAEHRRVMCAEALVPGAVAAGMIEGVYVGSADAAQALSEILPNVRATPHEYLFFRGDRLA